MEFLKKGAQAAKKLGTQLLEAVDGDAEVFRKERAQDEHRIETKTEHIQEKKTDAFEERDSLHIAPAGNSSSGSLENAEFESSVKHFMAVNANLKQLGVRTQTWVQSMRAQSSNGVAVGHTAVDSCKMQFEDDASWVASAEKVKDIAQILDSKYTAQLSSLLQRDILDPITSELETNKDTKFLIESIRTGRPTSEQIDDAVGKLHQILHRRRIILAQCVTVLGSHQYNYYVRLAEQFQTLHSFVADCKKRSSELSTGKPRTQTDSPAEGSSSPVAANRPASKVEAGTPMKEAPTPQVKEEPEPPAVEADLLGMLGDGPTTTSSSAAKAAAPVAAPVSVNLLDGGPSRAGPKSNADPLGDLFSPAQAVRPARPSPAPAPSAVDPLAAFLGSSSAPAPAPAKEKGVRVDEFGVTRVNGDDEDTKPIQQRARPTRESDFQGKGTSREELQRQFAAHVESKAAAAAAEIRKIDEEKKRYEDLKFQMSDAVEQRVSMWAGPKHTRKNLRAMLSSFDTVLWDEARAKWKPVGLHELVMPDQVKKVHRKAILIVHPDKVSGASMECKLLAEQVHAVLHEALEVFRKQENC